MNANKLFDLRFVIGVFFTIVGLLLLVFGFTNEAEAKSINTWCGGIFLVFGILMIVLSLQKDARDELLEEDN